MRKISIYTTISLWVAVLGMPSIVHAQFLDYGTDPSRLKWNQVALEHYSLIYPQGLDSMAYRYALYLENVYPHLMKTIGQPVKMSFPVVLHPASMIANGMVSWSPRRMELLTTPSYSQEAERWDKHLVTHESRHVLQTGKLMRGVFRPLYYLMGEQAAGVSSVFVPRWFFEGDAVGMETALTEGGRGRLPEFQMVYKAQLLSAKGYSFEKWYLGSYKDYTGDFYAFGYNLTSFARYKYGADIWERTTSRYIHHPFALPPFSKAFKHHTGIGFDQLFKDTYAYLRKEWESRDTGYDSPLYLSPPSKQYTSYKYPQAWKDSSLIALKTSLSDLPSLVALSKGSEQHLSYLGSINGRIVLHKERVYWLEHLSSIRWTHESHTVIKYYDLTSRRIRTLTPRRRYIAFALSDSTIAASLFTEEGESRIALIAKESGQEYKQYPTPGNVFIKDLAMGGKDTLYTLAVGEEGISLLLLNMQTGQWEELLQPTSANLTSPVYQDGRLFFESGLEGSNNLYCLDSSSRKAYRLSSARFGAFHPALSHGGKELLFSDYQAKGYRIASLPLDSLEAEEADFDRPSRFTLAETLSEQEDFKLQEASLKPVDFQPRPYRKGAHLFQIHSWAPIYYNVSEVVSGGAADFTSALKPGASLISQNALNTAIAQAGWYYDSGYHHGKLDFIYMGWLPIIHLNVDYGDKASDLLWRKNDEGAYIAVSQPAKRNLLEAQIQAYIPFNLTHNHYIRGIQPSLTYYFTNNGYQQYGKPLMTYFQYLEAELRFYHYRKMAHRDILPRLGYQLRLHFLNMPLNAANFSNLYAARLTTYWPGLLPNHSLMLRAGYHYQPVDEKPLYIPKQSIEAPRGYAYQYRSRQQAVFKADYAFPILMPDLRLGSLIYIRRLRANLFYDLAYKQATAQSGWTHQRSYGGDLIFDWNAMRFSFPLTTGVRVIQAVENANTQVEALFSVSF